MALLGCDLGGTKLAAALVLDDGTIIARRDQLLDGRSGADVAGLLIALLLDLTAEAERLSHPITGAGISVPGIARHRTGTVWAPNIPGWEDYPLRDEVQRSLTKGVRVVVDSDRTCAILGEEWKGAARGCRNAIYLTVGTGIGAGILADGHVLRGSQDIAGAVGWMSLRQPFDPAYASCGCFESLASGHGIAARARELVARSDIALSSLDTIPADRLSAQDVFAAYDDDMVAQTVIRDAIVAWGAAAANLVSLFDPERIIFGGGIFGPATRFIPQIRAEAERWAQPVSMRRVEFVPSALGGDAPLIGAASLAALRVEDPRSSHPSEG
ncbi:MAG: ROK family protein [Bacteroidetes bacterium]|jgi:glucokinase|nr:ROK family protein [Bacteroidota bacterium]